MMLQKITPVVLLGIILLGVGLQWGCDRSAVKPPDSAAADDPSQVPANATAGQPALSSETPPSQTGLNGAATDAGQGDRSVQMPSGEPTPGVANGVTAPRLDDQTELRNRPFATLQPKQTDDPQILLEHLREIDSAIQDLVLAGSSNLLDENSFTQNGLRLGRMKREAGIRLAEAPTASDEQRKSGKIAQLVALSHMSGLRDVESAQELEKYAGDLVNSGDPDLAHQSRVVLLGFELQALQNGIRDDPQELLKQLEQLFQRPQDRSFPEFMVLQQSQQVLRQLGFAEAADRVRQILITEYRSSPDQQLRGEAWLVEAQDSQAYQNFLLSFRSLGSPGFDAQAALAAVRGLYQAYPTLPTLEQIASTVSNIEYGGQVQLSEDIAEFVRQALGDHPTADQAVITKMLTDHDARVALLDNEVQPSGLIGFDGQPFDWSQYAGKVVMVDFWASWCVPCLREIPNIRQAYDDFHADGFEVVSVNMDKNLGTAREFVTKQAFPWRTFRSEDPQALGFASPLARQWGVSAIPFVVLVGRDGRVAAIHVRGDDLRPAISDLLKEAAVPTP